MGWSVGYLPPREPELLGLFLLSVGKALSIAIGFEAKCKHVLGLTTLVEKWTEGHDIDAADELVNEVQKRQQLCRAMIRIGTSFNIVPEGLAILQAAKDARNYIAHESAALACLSEERASSILTEYSDLWPRVHDLATGDNLVSAWCYEICEKEPAPIGIRNDYVKVVLDWVFRDAPINSDGHWEWLSIPPEAVGWDAREDMAMPPTP